MKTPGTLIISLDFELFWGMHDVTTLGEYGTRILGERQAIPAMLALFEKYAIHASWATVGMLGFSTRHDLERALPEKKPAYTNSAHSSYKHLASGDVGVDEDSDPYHYGASLLERIRHTPHQEIACHTFSHYYCLEDGADLESFTQDLQAWYTHLNAGAPASSIVFPRNQVDGAHLDVCASLGIQSYRGTQDSALHRPVNTEQQYRPLYRALRLLDAYINLTGHHTYPLRTQTTAPVNLPASRFLRPYSKTFSGIEWLKVRRIKKSIAHAAQCGEVFHLWWHPHNFGADLEQNLASLEDILAYTAEWRNKGMLESYTMAEAAMHCNHV